MISTFVSQALVGPARSNLEMPGDGGAPMDLASYRSAVRAARERALVAGFADAVGDLLANGSADADGAGVIAALRSVASGVDLALSTARPDAYGHRPLWRDAETGVSLSVVTLRYGQATEVHDHDGWGCALVVRGAERERRYAMDPSGELGLVESRFHAAGDAYVFDVGVIHEVIGRDPIQETVALHVLVPFQETNRVSQLLPEPQRMSLVRAA
jgi:predicted metal-dependent enzyme (double-stranded beta helix superfamily)